MQVHGGEMERIVVFGIAYLYIILFEPFQTMPTGICGGTNGTSCCVGFKWDLTQENCIPCNKGYMGSNCEATCPFPTYGEGCQMKCNCIDKDCDPVNGCNKSSSELSSLPSKDLQHSTATKELLKTNGDVFKILQSKLVDKRRVARTNR